MSTDENDLDAMIDETHEKTAKLLLENQDESVYAGISRTDGYHPILTVRPGRDENRHVTQHLAIMLLKIQASADYELRLDEIAEEDIEVAENDPELLDRVHRSSPEPESED